MLLLWLPLSFLAACSGEEKPNVLLITLDTTRADHLSCYGYDKNTSPRLDQLAESGVRFESAIAQAAVTPVSHASILTGLNPPSHGLRVLHGEYENRLQPRNVTLAEVLREEGYATAAFVSAFPVSEIFGMDQGYDTFDANFVVEDQSKIVGQGGVVNTGNNQRRGDATTDLALSWLEQVEGPFHLWVHYFDCHDDKIVPPKNELDAAGPWPRDPRARAKKLYDVEIEFTDRHMGRLIDALAQSQRRDNTISVVVSDHGEGLGDHNWWTHGVLYQEQVNVPLILVAPELPAGEVIPDLVSTTDILPTVLELARIDDAPRVEGVSLVGVATGQEKLDPMREAYSDSVNLMTYGTAVGFRDQKNDMLFSVVRDGWKYIHHMVRPDESELYDLRTDPNETKNLYRANQALANELRDLAVGQGQIPEKQLDHHGMSADDIQKLKDLGYVSGDQ